MKFLIGVEAVRSYRRLSYSPWHAIAEFIDNSTQAYFDNKKVLDGALRAKSAKVDVSVVYDRSAETLTVKDNSMGMNLTELEAALQVAGHPPRKAGRSKYGMGLKTAACWFGDRWKIKTKKLGEGGEITAVIDVNKIASGHTEIDYEVVEAGDRDSHYTELTISELHKKLPSRTLGKIKTFLCSMYRCDLREGTIDLHWQTSPLSWEGIDERILKAEGGMLYKKDLDFQVLEHRVRGWVAVLASGSREHAGFTILQNKRVIRGYPDAWRPTTIFGQHQGSNDLVNQRLVGEIYLDTFEVSHTKDDIVWAGEEEEALEEALLEHCGDYRKVASGFRKGADQRQPSADVEDSAVDQITRDLSSEEIVDAIELTEVPPEEIVDQTFREVVNQESAKQPRLDILVGTTRVRLHLSHDASINDPYYAIDITPEESIIVVVNMNHPYVKYLDEARAMTDYLRQCVFDALAENKARIQRGRIHPNTVRTHKDNLLRVPHQIHDLEPNVQRE